MCVCVCANLKKRESVCVCAFEGGITERCDGKDGEEQEQEQEEKEEVVAEERTKGNHVTRTGTVTSSSERESVCVCVGGGVCVYCLRACCVLNWGKGKKMQRNRN